MKKLMLVLMSLPMALFASTTWFVDATHGSNGYSGKYSYAPKKTIQAAINAASAGDTICVAGGVYYENLTLSKRLTLFSAEPAVSVVDGRLAGHCLLITESAAGCVVNGFLFTHGAPTNGGNRYGGGIDCLANATIRHCTFKDNGNSSTTFAGGLHTSNNAYVTVENCLFVGNYAWACGGASLTEGGSTAVFDRCTVFGNKSDDYIGNQGGLSVANTGTIIVRSCILWGNTGMQIAAYGSYYGAQSTIRVSYSCVQGGVAANGAGHFYNDGFNINTDPRFLNAPKHNFWFRDNSPCWRMGHPDYPDYMAPGMRPHMGFWPSRLRPPPPPVWTAVVTLDPQGGDCCVDSFKRFLNDRVGYLPDPQMDGYDFLGWFTEAEGGRRIYPLEIVKRSCTYYAHWQQRIPPLFEVVGKTTGIDSLVELNFRKEDGARDGILYLNGHGKTNVLASTELEAAKWIWQPEKIGENVFIYDTGKSSVTQKVSVARLTFATEPKPEPGRAPDPNVKLASDGPAKPVPAGGGMYSVRTQGTSGWTASVSDDWIELNATSGEAGKTVAFTVVKSTQVGERVGFVYVSGHVYTIHQLGQFLDVTPDDIQCDANGGSGELSIDIPAAFDWDARPESSCDWITISKTHGNGRDTITYTVAPYNEVTDRTGSIKVGDKTITVYQVGRPMKLVPESMSVGYGKYEAEVAAVTVDALKITEWSVTENASWLAVVNKPAGTKKGGDSLLVAVGANPSYRARSGTITIGTETFTVYQEGNQELELNIDPVNTTASVNGANGHIAVTGTSDYPWSAESKSNWLVLQASSASGAGNGNIYYAAQPNTSIEPRTGTIVITTATGEKLTHTVTQPGAVATLSLESYEFEAKGGTVDVDVTVGDRIQWEVSESLDWLTVLTGTSYMGPQTVTLQASANQSTDPRSGTLTIGGRTFSVRQKPRGISLSYTPEDTCFDYDGGFGFIKVIPSGDVDWTATVSDPDWIIIEGCDPDGSYSDSGTGGIMFTIASYLGDGEPTTGWIKIGSETIVITQRPYDLSISPSSAAVSGNAGEGEISVTPEIEAIWHVLDCSPWIKITSSDDYGNGMVYFEFEANDTGRTRTGWINIDGEVYTLTQAARVIVNIDVAVEGRGSVEGAGIHSQGERVTLTAVPDDGYEFDYWSGDIEETQQNPIKVTADVAKRLTAKFSPLTPDLITAESTVAGVNLTWRNLAWAQEYRVYRAPTSEFPPTPIATLTAGCTYLDESAELEKTYWYWVEAVGPGVAAEDEPIVTRSADPKTAKKVKPIIFSPITYTNLRGATHSNPPTYQEETSVSFTAPSAVTGYTFTGWDPSIISSDMTGAIDVRATWSANTYTIVYSANGGSGTMDAVSCTYDKTVQIADCAYAKVGHTFMGWATSAQGAVAYAPGETVINLTSAQGGLVTLFAVWQVNTYLVNGEEVAYGTNKKFTAPDPVVDGEGTTQYVSLGTSAYPEKGAEFNLVITEDVDFAWDLIQTNFWLEAEPPENGTIQKDGEAYVDQWIAAGQTVELTAVPNANYDFSAWYGDTDGCTAVGATLSVVMSKPRTVGATFVYVPQITEVATPVITPADGASFVGDSQIVTIDCATPGATIYYSTNGSTPKTTEANKYTGPFQITDTTTVKAVAVKDGLKSAYVTAVITKRTLTLADAVGAPDLTFTTGGDADWKGVADATAKVGTTSARSGTITDEQTSWIETTVTGSGTISFWWKVSCEKDEGGIASWDHLEVSVDGKWMASIDGITDWAKISYDLEGEAGVTHTIRWTYTKEESDLDGEDCAWIDGVVWASAAPAPIVVDDPNGKIVIPPGTDPATLDIKIMSNGHDIRSYLDLPAVKNGEIDLSQATVKEEIVKEALTGEGSEVTLDAANPTITTAKTIPGLTYTFREGTSIEALSGKTPLTHPGDGKSWTPPVTVKGGNAAFYSIGVTK